jgi:hypothetical protein
MDFRLPATVLDVGSNRYQTVMTKRGGAYPVNAVALTGSSPRREGMEKQ